MATIRERWWPAPIPRLANGEVDKEKARAAGKRCTYICDFFDQQGVRRQKSFKRRKDADSFMVTTRAQVQTGVYTPESTSATVGEAIDLWIERAVAEQLEHGTRGQYAQHKAHILALIDGSTKLAKLTQARVEQLRDDLLKAHSRPMARKILASFKGVLREAKRRGLVAQNVAADTTIGTNGRHKRKLRVGVDLPTVDEFRAMLATASDLKSRAMISLAGIAGLRASELRGLPWADLDLGPKPGVTITQRADAWGKIGSPKSESAHRTIELGEMTVRALREWRLAQPPLVTKDEHGNEIKRPRTLVFGTASDKPDMLGNLQDRVL